MLHQSCPQSLPVYSIECLRQIQANDPQRDVSNTNLQLTSVLQSLFVFENRVTLLAVNLLRLVHPTQHEVGKHFVQQTQASNGTKV